MQPYHFPHKREESYDLTAWVRQWFERRSDVIEVRDVQDHPNCFYRGDLLIVRGDGTTQFVEIKCESSYTRETTENLAIERYSSIDKNTPGGPWSTVADFFAHIYADGLLVIMNRHELVAWLERELTINPQAFPYREIPNVSWTTGTYLVPRSAVRRALGKWYREYEAQELRAG